MHYPSMYQDFSNGRKTEVDYINGWIADLADREGTEAKNQRIVQNMVHLAEAMRQFKK
nr:ketopantoate reductase C-terminal domain-containing protein [Oenococcus oeni]